jgi:hypothetical protein
MFIFLSGSLASVVFRVFHASSVQRDGAKRKCKYPGSVHEDLHGAGLRAPDRGARQLAVIPRMLRSAISVFTRVFDAL